MLPRATTKLPKMIIWEGGQQVPLLAKNGKRCCLQCPMYTQKTYSPYTIYGSQVFSLSLFYPFIKIRGGCVYSQADLLGRAPSTRGYISNAYYCRPPYNGRSILLVYNPVNIFSRYLFFSWIEIDIHRETNKQKGGEQRSSLHVHIAEIKRKCSSAYKVCDGVCTCAFLFY